MSAENPQRYYTHYPVEWDYKCYSVLAFQTSRSLTSQIVILDYEYVFQMEIDV